MQTRGEAVLTRLGQRPDDELLAALAAGRREVVDGGHGLLRHGPDASHPALKRRLTEGVAPDGKVHRNAPPGSTRFESYADWLDTRQKALDAIAAGKSSAGQPIDFRHPPGVGGNPARDEIKVIVEHVRPARSRGRGYIGEPHSPVGQKKIRVTRADGSIEKVWPGVEPVHDGVTRVLTTIVWDRSIDRWRVVQHYPVAGQTSFDAASRAYRPGADTPHVTY